MIKVDKNKLLNTEVNNNFGSEYDELGRPCIKCAFLQSMEGYRITPKPAIEDLYWYLLGFYEGKRRDQRLRVTNTELVQVLDKYEMLGCGKKADKKELLTQCVQELEEKKLVEFI